MWRIIAAFALFIPLSAFAAVAPVTRIPVSLDANPSYQAPGTSVTITAYSRAPEGVYTYVWGKDGVEIARGIDVMSVTVAAGAAGTETEVSLILETPQGEEIGSATYAIRPASVDIVWEGATYVPPFYGGKRYPNGDSSIVLEAIPEVTYNGTRVPAQDLVYTWEADGKQVAKGYGRSSVRISPARFKSATNVTVIAETPEGGVAARAAATIPTVSPVLRFYEERSLAGVWFKNALYGTVPFSGEEMTFRAVPYFATDPENLSYNWSLNGSPVSAEGGKPYIATFRKTSDGTGVFTVGVAAQRAGSIFERAAAAFNLSFN